MGSFKKPKKQREDQPTMFGIDGGPVAAKPVAKPAGEDARGRTGRRGVQAPLKTSGHGALGEVRTNETPPTRRVSGPSATYGRYLPVYHKRTSSQTITIEESIDAFDEVDPFRRARAAYLSRSLLSVEILGDTIDMPDMILVRFHADEYPSPPRECWRLTGNLMERVLTQCAAAEAAWERGEMTDVDYQIMRARFAIASALYDRLPRTWEYETKGGPPQLT